MTAPPPGSGDGRRAAEEAAWAELVGRWDDPLAHRAYLSRIPDVEGLARAGARYRAVLEERPGDPVASAGRDEVLRRATLLGLAAVPRAAPPPRAPPWVKFALAGALVLLAAGLAVATVLALLRGGALR